MVSGKNVENLRLLMFYLMRSFACRFSCACKKVLMANRKNDLTTADICEHILLVLAAILSDLNLHKEFEHLLSAIRPLLSSSINIDYQQWNRNVS